ncbi:MAG TPA: hypothetical protein VF893_04535, partial [Candidatus Bathyarchaeia archaeon]
MKEKISATTAIFLLLAITVSLVAMPAALAQSTRKITSYAYVSAEPNPVGVGQTTYISVWVDASLPEALFINDIRRHDYKLTVTAPDGTKTTNSWPMKAEGVESLTVDIPLSWEEAFAGGTVRVL